MDLMCVQKPLYSPRQLLIFGSIAWLGLRDEEADEELGFITRLGFGVGCGFGF